MRKLSVTHRLKQTATWMDYTHASSTDSIYKRNIMRKNEAYVKIYM